MYKGFFIPKGDSSFAGHLHNHLTCRLLPPLLWSRHDNRSKRMVHVILSLSLPVGGCTSLTNFKFSGVSCMTQNSIQTPEMFNPKRFLESATAAYTTDRCNGANDDDGDGQDDTTPIGRRWRINDPSLISLAFGAGKRICPGETLPHIHSHSDPRQIPGSVHSVVTELLKYFLPDV